MSIGNRNESATWPHNTAHLQLPVLIWIPVWIWNDCESSNGRNGRVLATVESVRQRRAWPEELAGGRSESTGSATTQGGEARGMSSARCIGWVTPHTDACRSPSWLDRPSVHVRLAPVDDSWDAPAVFRGAERFFEYRGIPNYGTSATTDTVQSLKWSLRGSAPAGPLRTRSVLAA